MISLWVKGDVNNDEDLLRPEMCQALCLVLYGHHLFSGHGNHVGMELILSKP